MTRRKPIEKNRVDPAIEKVVVETIERPAWGQVTADISIAEAHLRNAIARGRT